MKLMKDNISSLRLFSLYLKRSNGDTIKKTNSIHKIHSDIILECFDAFCKLVPTMDAQSN